MERLAITPPRKSFDYANAIPYAGPIQVALTRWLISFNNVSAIVSNADVVIAQVLIRLEQAGRACWPASDHIPPKPSEERIRRRKQRDLFLRQRNVPSSARVYSHVI